MILKGCRYGMIKSEKITEDDSCTTVLLEAIERGAIMAATYPGLISPNPLDAIHNIIVFNNTVESIIDEVISGITDGTCESLYDLECAMSPDEMASAYEDIKEIMHNSKMTTVEEGVYNKVASDLADNLNQELCYFDKPLLGQSGKFTY